MRKRLTIEDMQNLAAAKGGVRRERLPLYVAEYVWRYNHRRFSVDGQVKRLLNLLHKRSHPGGSSATLPYLFVDGLSAEPALHAGQIQRIVRTA